MAFLRNSHFRNRKHSHSLRYTIEMIVFIFSYVVCAITLAFRFQTTGIITKKSGEFWPREAYLKNTTLMVPRSNSDGSSLLILGKMESERSKLILIADLNNVKDFGHVFEVLVKMDKDPDSLLSLSRIYSFNEFGFVFELLAGDDKTARRMWEKLGQHFLLSPKYYGQIDFSHFEGAVPDSVEVKEAIGIASSIGLEAYCSIPSEEYRFLSKQMLYCAFETRRKIWEKLRELFSEPEHLVQLDWAM